MKRRLPRPRLIFSILIGIATWFAWPHGTATSTRTILSLDCGGIVFLGLTWWMMAHATTERMKLRSRFQDERKTVILMLTGGAAIFSLTAIGIELGGLKSLPEAAVIPHVALAAISLVVSWLVTHTMFALHYAHSFYGDADGDPATPEHRAGLIFPECEQPDYWDFMYFSLVVGMTCQTSDVQVSSKPMRRLCLAQGVLAFFFNTVILAMAINIAAGLL
jgi:uncharacterized membrane protein